ncbi:MAG: ribosomal L7Ae/L30e/S12e/Gadd45 family protein [Candidatus Thermoplasmatota archaeon]|nr:ribosomal L7Ae/L30e/S12e/Gadd45 family protein [Candidatus Thermoplasmatota archaeon]
MDINTAIRILLEQGKVTVGFETTKKAFLKNNIKLAIVSSNLPQKKLEIIKSSAPVFKYKGSNSELGVACGKPFPVSIIGIIEAPEKILKAFRNFYER